MSDLREKLLSACESLDTANISAVLEEGADINEVNEDGESVLDYMLSIYFDAPNIYEIVKFLLERGADPNLVDEEKSGPLTGPTLQMNVEIIELLCEHGADPNAYGGFSEEETLYDWAEYDYRLEIYGGFQLPEDPTEDDKKDEESWLAYLQRVAVKYDKKEPTHLFVLRKYGSKSWYELHGNDDNNVS